MVHWELLITPTFSDLSIISCPAHPGAGTPRTFLLAPCRQGPGGGRGKGVMSPHSYRTSAATPSHLGERPVPPRGCICRHIWAGAAPPRGHIWRRRGAALRRGGRSGGSAQPRRRPGRAEPARRAGERRPDGAAGRQPGPAPAAAAPGAGARLDLPGGATGRRQVSVPRHGAEPRGPVSVHSRPLHPPPSFSFSSPFCFLIIRLLALQGGLLREQNRHHPVPLPKAHGRAHHLLQVSAAAAEGGGVSAEPAAHAWPRIRARCPGGECVGHTRVDGTRGGLSSGIYLPPLCSTLTYPGIFTPRGLGSRQLGWVPLTFSISVGKSRCCPSERF